MIDITSLGKYQQYLLNINSANYKYETLQNCTQYIESLVSSGEFDFFTISEDINNIYQTNNYFYNYLENKLTYFEKLQDTEHYIGYNELNIEALLYGIYNPDPSFIIHDELYTNLNNIYQNFFSNISEHSIYSIFYNNFKVDTLNISNYLKVCFDKEDKELNYKLANFYILPMRDFSSICTPQILTSIRRQLYHSVRDNLQNQILHFNELTGLNSKLAHFILVNIFNDFKFNDSYKNEIIESVNISGLLTTFNKFIDSLPLNNILTCINNIYIDFIQEFAYILMTECRTNGSVKFSTPESIYTNSIFGLNEIIYKEDPIIFDLLTLKEKPTIFYLVDSNTILLRFENVDYKVTNKIPNTRTSSSTFSHLLSIVNSTNKDGYINFLKNKFVTYQDPGIFLKTGYTKTELIQLAQNANLIKLSTTKHLIPKNSIYKTLIGDILLRTGDLKSVITLTYKYRNEPLQFINSTLAVFSDWLDLILDIQYNNKDYIDVLSNDNIVDIINSIGFDIPELTNFINSNFINLFKNSKVIELNVYHYFGELVDKFIKTQAFKDFILFEFIEPIAQVLRTRSPKLYKEIYQNIDNIINYIKYLLILELYNTVNLQSRYRDILEAENVEIINFNEEILQYLILDFKKIDAITIKKYKNESTKFTTSMAMLFLLDKYIDGFRLIKKYQTYNIEKVVYDEYNSIVTVYLDDIHNLELGRGVTILGNPGNINGYKIVYSPDDRGTTHFTFYQPDAKIKQGGTISIKRPLNTY